jgi:hypothetical protein
LPDKPSVFIETMLVRFASKFMGADDDSIRARVIGVLLPAKGGGWTAAEQILWVGARVPGHSALRMLQVPKTSRLLLLYLIYSISGTKNCS